MLDDEHQVGFVQGRPVSAARANPPTSSGRRSESPSFFWPAGMKGLILDLRFLAGRTPGVRAVQSTRAFPLSEGTIVTTRGRDGDPTSSPWEGRRQGVAGVPFPPGRPGGTTRRPRPPNRSGRDRAPAALKDNDRAVPDRARGTTRQGLGCSRWIKAEGRQPAPLKLTDRPTTTFLPYLPPAGRTSTRAPWGLRTWGVDPTEGDLTLAMEGPQTEAIAQPGGRRRGRWSPSPRASPAPG